MARYPQMRIALNRGAITLANGSSCFGRKPTAAPCRGLLAEPREQVPYDHICRLLRVSEHTLKAIEKAESASIAERKQALLGKAMRIAHKAADRIEDQIDSAKISQATITFGVAVDKISLLGGDPTIHIQHSLELGPNLYEKLASLANAINARSAAPRTIGTQAEPLAALRALPNGEAISDSGR
jgi:hypothetical protein